MPTAEEAAHDFLWRIHKRVPGKGEIGVFNRSHYEEVLVVRVHELVPPDVWSGRYELISEFEKLLAAPARRSSSSSCTSARKSSASAFRNATTIPRSAGSSRWATWQSASGGTSTRAAYEDALSKMFDERCAVVRHPSEPQLVPRPGDPTILADTHR